MVGVEQVHVGNPTVLDAEAMDIISLYLSRDKNAHVGHTVTRIVCSMEQSNSRVEKTMWREGDWGGGKQGITSITYWHSVFPAALTGQVICRL